jgi:hypothetical protein
MRKYPLIVFLIIPGLIGFLVFGGYGMIDFVALQRAYIQFEHAANSGVVADIIVAEAKQNIHRVNLFAEGVWSLLSAIIAAIGIYGLCVKTVPTLNND